MYYKAITCKGNIVPVISTFLEVKEGKLEKVPKIPSGTESKKLPSKKHIKALYIEYKCNMNYVIRGSIYILFFETFIETITHN